MKKLLALLLLAALPMAAQNTTLQKTPSQPAGSNANKLTDPSKVIVVGDGGSISATGTGQINATSVAGGSIVPSAPLTGGGPISGVVDLGITKATSSVDGYLFHTDWATFNAKQSALTFTAPIVNSAGTVAMAASTGSVNGYLTSADWTTFNAKESALTFSAPLSRATNAISIPASTNSVDGYLTAADHTSLSAKQPAGNYLTALTGDVSAAGPGSSAATLATVASPGTSGSSTAIPVVTIDAKGRTTSVTTAAVVAPAGTLTGTTLASNVVTSSLTTVGTIGTGVWNGTPIANAYLANSTVTVGSTAIALGGTATTIAGLSSLTSTAITANSVAAAASTNLTVSGGSSGAAIALGQGTTSGNITFTPTGTGTLVLPNTKAFRFLTNASSTSPYNAEMGGSSNGDSTFNDVLYFGYNITQGGSKINSGDPAFSYQMESNYLNLGNRHFEAHLAILTSAGVASRPYSFIARRDDPTQYMGWTFQISPNSSGYWTILDVGGFNTLYSFSGDGIVRFVPNNTSLHFVGSAPSIQDETPGGVMTYAVGTGGSHNFTGGNLAVDNSTILGGANNMTITAGTGNDRIMTLRTTNGSGTAQTVMTLANDQTAYTANNLGVGGAPISFGSTYRTLDLNSVGAGGSYILARSSTVTGQFAAVGTVSLDIGTRTAHPINIAYNNGIVATFNATVLNVAYTTASTTSANGALTVAGGAGIAGAVNVGGAGTIGSTIDATTGGGGSFATAGGIYAAKKLISNAATFDGTAAVITGINSFTAVASADLVLNGGSSGSVLTVGNSSGGGFTLAPGTLASGVFSYTGTLDASDSVTAGFKVASGLAVAKAIAAGGNLTVGGGVITGGAANMTITAGTGNSRTLALQSTTSGGAATTFLTGNANQSVTLANALTISGALTGATSLVGTNSVTAAATTDFVATGGSSGAALTLKQGTNANAYVIPSGNGAFGVGTNNPTQFGAGYVTMDLLGGSSGAYYLARTSSTTAQFAAVEAGANSTVDLGTRDAHSLRFVYNNGVIGRILSTGLNIDATTEATTGGAGAVVSSGGIYSTKKIIGNSDVEAVGNFVTDTAGKTILIKSGTNAAAGTVTLVAGTATITSTAIDANTVISFSEKTAGGTPGVYQPLAAVSSGSAVVTSAATDTSTYNWVAVKVN